MGGCAQAPYGSALVMRNDASELARMAEWIEGVCTTARLSRRTSFALQLCLDEATANIIAHGEGSTRAREIVVSIAHEGAEVVLTVDDDGGPFDVTRVAPPDRPHTLEDAPVGGRGIQLIRRFSSSFEYRRKCGRNQLRMTFAEA
jgi:serine/threonine-protein kinase RsbW